MILKFRDEYDRLYGIGVKPQKAIKPYLLANPVIFEAGAQSGNSLSGYFSGF
jgi:hypothetical protein